MAFRISKEIVKPIFCFKFYLEETIKIILLNNEKHIDNLLYVLYSFIMKNEGGLHEE